MTKHPNYAKLTGSKQENKNMEKQPKFIRDFAKDQSEASEAEVGLSPRDELAHQIREKRSEAFDREETLAEKRQELDELADKVTYISENVLRIITNYFKLRKLKSELATKTDVHEILAMADAEKQIDGTPEEFLLAEQMLADYQQKMDQEWSQSDYTKEEVETLFTEEYLSSLTTEEYIKFLQRFPASVVTHVTRQGIRDHTGHMYHQSGVGQLSDGFKDMLKDGRLRPTFAMLLKDDAILQELAASICEGHETEEDALDRFHNSHDITGSSPREGFADHLAVHFAANQVADCYYGAETGNEVFILYPGMMIVGQTIFQDEHSAKFNFEGKRSSESARNNIYSWDIESQGFLLDAGIVFLPKDTEVDPSTGSKYLIDKDGFAINDDELIQNIAMVVASEEFQALARESYELFHSEDRLGLSYDKATQRQKEIQDRVIGIIMKTIGLSAEQAKKIIIGRNITIKAEALSDLNEHDPESEMISGARASSGPNYWIQKSLLELGLLYKKPEITISSQQYWEQYFTEHPEQRPTHVVYYDGDPTEALLSWQKANGIIKENPDEYLGYEDHYVHDIRTDERIDPIVGRYIKLVEMAIHEHYKKQRAEVAA